jgi:DNA-binding response OmpR family regulator
MIEATILAADDDRVVRKILDQFLTDAGFTVVLACDGKEALDKLLAEPDRFDAVLLDRTMPNMDGMDVLKAIRADARFVSLPVIIQTALSAAKQVQEGYDEGAYYYVTKPYDAETLVTIVRSAVEKYREFRSVMNWMVEATAGMALLEQGVFRLRSIEEARIAASLLGELADDSVRVTLALKELIENAIEHGNLNIGGEEKLRLIADGRFVQEIERRLSLPEYEDKVVRVAFAVADDAVRVSIKDQGAGFDFDAALQPVGSGGQQSTCHGIIAARAARFDSMEYRDGGTLIEVTFPASTI